MAKTVYVLGAGSNMVVRHQSRGIHPPLACDFFQQLHSGLPAERFDLIQNNNSKLYEYINHYWKLGVHELSTADFDLEECFTLLEQHEKDATRHQNYADYYRLWEIKGQLTALLTGLLDEISENQLPGAEGLRPLARRVLDEKAAVVTFNYDTLLEQAIIEELAGQPWDPILAYAAPFDEFEPGNGEPPIEFRSARFPAQAHKAPFLKLHGSLNWFRYTDFAKLSSDGTPQRAENRGQTLVRPVDSPRMVSAPGYILVRPDGNLLEQLIITPVLNKDVAQKPFAHIWKKAREEMRECSRLVVCGYSFPPSDFATQRLFLESFVEGPPDELVIINPDTSVVSRVKYLCHFEGLVSVCSDLREFTGG
jgi:hypothetical protein